MDLNECGLILWSEINQGKYRYRFNYEQKGKNVNNKVEFLSYVLQRMHIKTENYQLVIIAYYTPMNGDN